MAENLVVEKETDSTFKQLQKLLNTKPTRKSLIEIQSSLQFLHIGLNFLLI